MGVGAERQGVLVLRDRGCDLDMRMQKRNSTLSTNGDCESSLVVKAKGWSDPSWRRQRLRPSVRICRSPRRI